MLTAFLNFLKTCGLKQISINALILVVVSVVLIAYAGDNRYMMKEEGQQIQQYQMDELDDRLFALKLKEQGMTQEQIDAAMKERWEKRYQAMEEAAKE